uniref:photosystem II reaction center W protein, chloroplastic-like n=1 Tax=Erigeron canadensis TaxID=72917 RepID=UPI001CB896B2|nr:photosystem II reaction center W protein, chloroplastic-like [Erigeron canadensis]
MASVSACTPTLLPNKPSTILGLPAICKMVKVTCSVEKGKTKENPSRLVMTSASSLVAATTAATMSSPMALALVDERMSTEGTGLPFGLSNNLLGWILFGVFGLIWTLYFVYTGSLDEDEDSGLSL